MSLTIDLPPDIVRRLTEEALRQGQAPEELVRVLVSERFPNPGDRSQRIAALLDQWDAQDDAAPLAGPVIVPPRASFKRPGLG